MSDIPDPPTLEGFDDDWEPALKERVGQVIAGRYRLDALMGRGGMGCVYRAQHLELNESVVIKLIDPVFALDPLARARFRLEAKALIRLRHPGVVAMHEFGEHEGGLFIAMELLEGRTLGAEAHQAGDALPIPRTLEIFQQLGGVLEATHAAGVIHRDIKPDNVMLVPDKRGAGAATDRVKLMDFGLAHLHEPEDSRLSATGSVLGTPSYMSPEQCFGRQVSPASDIYSLGIMLFEMLTGRRPFDDQTPAVVMSQHMFVAPPKMDRLAARVDVPPGLAILVEDMLAKKPETRPTAQQFLLRLEEIRGGSDALGFGASASERRFADAAKSREERALPLPDPRRVESDPTLMAPAPTGERPRIWLGGFSPAREVDLAATLAVNGIDAQSVAALPPPAGDGEIAPEILLVSGASENVMADVRAAFSASLGGGAFATLVVDVTQASAIPALIRGGASDVVLAILGDETVATKTWRLIRRKR
ncbi:MAG TPA: serine/threonine-protein kinase [Polyangia bacterium]|jgi:hypothetical protein